MKKIDYKKAGVDIKKADDLIRWIKKKEFCITSVFRE